MLSSSLSFFFLCCRPIPLRPLDRKGSEWFVGSLDPTSPPSGRPPLRYLPPTLYYFFCVTCEWLPGRLLSYGAPILLLAVTFFWGGESKKLSSPPLIALYGEVICRIQGNDVSDSIFHYATVQRTAVPVSFVKGKHFRILLHQKIHSGNRCQCRNGKQL